MSLQLPAGTGNVRTIAVHEGAGHEDILFVGTTNNCILEIGLTGGRWNILVQVYELLLLCLNNQGIYNNCEPFQGSFTGWQILQGLAD